jgi:superfamily II DNA or RNA helicase
MLSERLERFFDYITRNRGLEYFRGNRVKITGGQTGVTGRVRGTENYFVNIDVEDNIAHGFCECPRFADEGACKHIWATLLKAEQAGYLINHGAPITTYVDDTSASEFDSQLEDDDDYDDRPYQTRSSSKTKAKPVKKAAPKPKILDPWESLIKGIHQEASKQQTNYFQKEVPWPANRQVLYLISPGERPLYSGYSHKEHLTVAICQQEVKQNGDWSKPKNITGYSNYVFPLEIDQAIKLMLPNVGQNYSYHYHYTQNTACLSDAQESILVRKLCETGRCFFRPQYSTQAGDYLATPLVWEEGDPWQWHLRISTKPGGKQFNLQPVLIRGEVELKMQDVHYLSKAGLVFLPGKVARYEHGQAYAWVEKFRKEPNVVVPTSKADDLLKLLHSGTEIPRVLFPAELHFNQVRSQPRPHIVLKPLLYGKVTVSGFHEAEAFMDYDGKRFGIQDPVKAEYDEAARRLTVRDTAYEREALALLKSVGMNPQNQYSNLQIVSTKHVPTVISELGKAGWTIELEGKKIQAATGKFQFDVSSGIDWFELNGSVPFGETRATLPKLLAALRKGEQYVVLEDGSMGHIPAEFLKEFGLLTRLGEEKNGAIRFKRSQAGLLDALLASRPDAVCDQTFQAVRDELSQFDGIAEQTPPKSFLGELRPYQSVGLGWFDFLRRFKFGGCLADDMGLGKTVQVLALLEQRRLEGNTKPTLVVVPRSLIFNWKQEAARFAPQLKILDHSERDRLKENDHFGEYHIILTTYAILRMDILLFEKFSFDYVILDEAHAVKNDKSESAKAARLLKAEHRLALSGTPIENHLGELWSLFEFLNPGMLGSASIFKLAGSKEASSDSRLPLLARALKPFVLRRTKEQVAKELPAKVEQTIYCEMEPKHRKLYNELRDSYRAKLLGRVASVGLAKSKIYVLEALLRLRQAACHPGLLDKKLAKDKGAKLETLFTHLDEVLSEGRKVLIFSQFTSFLNLLQPHLEKLNLDYLYLDGKVKDRQSLVDRFQNDPKCQLFLISLKAGGLGLNLTAAEYVFMLDPWWNPAAEAQAIDRAHRIGQTKQVFAYRLIVKDTVEEKVLELQQQKRQLADAIISADQGMLKTLQKEDLELLLS